MKRIFGYLMCFLTTTTSVWRAVGHIIHSHLVDFYLLGYYGIGKSDNVIVYL